MKRIITWIDLQGRYRITSPAYASLAKLGMNEDDAINWVWASIVASGLYGIEPEHPMYLVEDADQRARLVECCGTYFRYAGKPDANGRRGGEGGAWDIDVDGRPKINMVKAQAVQMDYIRVERAKALKDLDDLQARAVGRADDAERSRLEQSKQRLRDLPATFDLSNHTTPAELKAAWPAELPPRTTNG